MQADIVRAHRVQFADAPGKVGVRDRIHHDLAAVFCRGLDRSLKGRVLCGGQRSHDVRARFKGGVCLVKAAVHDLEVGKDLEMGVTRAELAYG